MDWLFDRNTHDTVFLRFIFERMRLEIKIKKGRLWRYPIRYCI